jgi:integrase
MQRPLTDNFIRNISPPASGRTEIADARCAGLSFRITCNGARSWSFRYTDPTTRRDTRLTLGKYPDLTLGKARELADGHRKAVAEGKDPAAEKRKARQGADAATFGHLAQRYLDEYARRRKRSHANDDRNLRLHVLPKWRMKAYARITRADVIELLEGIVSQGKLVLVNRVQALISKIFAFAIDADLLTASPCYRLQRRGFERAGRRVLSDAELRLFWSRVVDAPVSYQTGLALRLALLTGARVSEVAGLCRDELHDIQDGERATWIIPGERTKNGLAHAVPLGPKTRAIVLEMLGQLEMGDRFLFRSRTRRDAPTKGATLSNAMLRFGNSLTGDGEAIRTWKADQPSAHDLRRTFATRMAALGVVKELRDRLLNHSPAGGDTERKHYNVYDYLPEKRRALLQWDATLGTILDGTSAVVVAIGSARASR